MNLWKLGRVFQVTALYLPEVLSWLWPDGGIVVIMQLDPVDRSGERLTPWQILGTLGVALEQLWRHDSGRLRMFFTEKEDITRVPTDGAQDGCWPIDCTQIKG